MIPNIIHYCWFGGKSKPKLIKDCIKSWNLHLPDYEIVEWNEKNTDLTLPFVKEAYILKQWAFVADYIRLKVLYEFGGIYLDTDMMVLKKFDSLLGYKCFFGAEDKDFISCGIIGTEKQHWFIKKSLDYYNNIQFSQELNLRMNTIPRVITGIFRENFKFYNSFDSEIELVDLIIFPQKYFYPFPYSATDKIKKYKEYIQSESFTVHLWNSSWVQHSEFHYLRKREYRKGLGIILENLFTEQKLSLKYWRKIASSIKQSTNYRL